MICCESHKHLGAIIVEWFVGVFVCIVFHIRTICLSIFTEWLNGGQALPSPLSPFIVIDLSFLRFHLKCPCCASQIIHLTLDMEAGVYDKQFRLTLSQIVIMWFCTHPGPRDTRLMTNDSSTIEAQFAMLEGWTAAMLITRSEISPIPVNWKITAQQNVRNCENGH